MVFVKAIVTGNDDALLRSHVSMYGMTGLAGCAQGSQSVARLHRVGANRAFHQKLVPPLPKTP